MESFHPLGRSTGIPGISSFATWLREEGAEGEGIAPNVPGSLQPLQ